MLFSCKQNKLKDVQAFAHNEKIPVISAKDVLLYYSEEAKLKVKLESPLMNRYVEEENDYLEMPEGVNVLFYDSLDKVSSRLRANYAISYETKKMMEAKNDVVVVNEKNEQLNTEHLIWDQKEHKIYTEAFVKITSEDKIFYGEGMESDEKLENWKLKKVKGIFKVDMNRKTENNSEPQ